MVLDDTKTLAERILRLEQKLQRLEKREGRPSVELFDNSAIRNRKIIDDLLVHNHSHANLLGLGADDHTQYTKHPASSTDNAIPRWDGTGGRTLQNSSVAIDDNGKLSGDGLDGWIYDTDTWTYVSTTSFKVSGKDVCYKFPKGTKIKLVQNGNTKYFYVVATAYSTDTTITITGGSDYSLAEAAISGQAYSYAAAPQNFPQFFNYNVGWTCDTGAAPSLGNGTLTGRFRLIGTSLLMRVFLQFGSTTTGGDGGHWQFNVPVTGLDYMYIGIAHIRDTGTNNYERHVQYYPTDFSVIKYFFGLDNSTNLLYLTHNTPFTWANTDILTFQLEYEI